MLIASGDVFLSQTEALNDDPLGGLFALVAEFTCVVSNVTTPTVRRWCPRNGRHRDVIRHLISIRLLRLVDVPMVYLWGRVVKGLGDWSLGG